MADSYHIIDGQVVPFHGGRKDTNTGAWRDATPLELKLQEQLAAAEEALAEAADALEEAQEDTARLDWLSQHDVGICHLGYGDYQWYTYANPVPEHGMLGLRATIDAARKEARNG